MKKFLMGLVALMVMMFVLVACGGENGHPGSIATTPQTETTTATQEANEPAQAVARDMYDREGFAVTIPAEINTIVSIAPSNTEVLMALGFANNIVATDDQPVEGIDSSIAVLSMWGIDLEHIIGLNPDLIVASSMIMFDGDPLQAARDAGIAVVYIPSSDSIAKVKDDIRFLADILGAQARGEEVIAQMQTELDSVAQIVSGITNQRTVYFEISASPFTFGHDTFLHELVELAGGINIFADQTGWISPSLESVIEIDPEVILTSTNYIPSAVEEILTRAGFESLQAVTAGDVHFIDTDLSSRPSQNVVYAIRQIAEAIYPEYFR